jgi:vacuolar-type H+-ATPase subunit E/Vma4
MALTDILEKIKSQMLVEIEKLEKEFNEKKKKLEKVSQKRQKEIDEFLHKKIDEKSKEIIEKAEKLAEREAQNNLLKAKRELIGGTLEKSITELSNHEQYEKILTSMLKKTAFPEDAVVIPAKGKEDQTKSAIQNSGKSYFLSEKSADITGGFIIKTEKIEIDNSFETILNSELRQDLEIRLHKLLF